MQRLFPDAQERNPKSFTQNLEMGFYLTSGPRWAGNGGLGPAETGRGKRNSERGELFSVWLLSLASLARAPQRPGPTHKGFRMLSFRTRCPRGSGGRTTGRIN